MNSAADTRLLNITTLTQLMQLEAKVPGFIERQLEGLRLKWPESQESFKKMYNDGDAMGIADLLHKLKGHIGMIGLTALHDRIGLLEDTYRLTQQIDPEHEIKMKDLNSLFHKTMVELSQVLPTLAPL